MEMPPEPDQVTTRLLSFIRTSFLAGDPEGELGIDTPLLEFGILNSLNTAEMIAYVHEEFGVSLAFDEVTATTFKTVASLSALVSARTTVDSTRR
ncbi:acyl carrier protein [Actinophytocola glycyrrhizae]|uniref:Acyl carrier protein n=1 Tax=Actinophytocola glycyrrhizae TaxID=2044873 RepID=A0ABV9RTF9_9PSEU